MSKRILIVDDDAYIVHLLEVVLRGRGYGVDSASDGVEALAKIQESMPDMVLLDVAMPQLSGWDVLSALRAAANTRELPVIMCTSRDLISDVEKAESLGANGYIPKPFEVDRLVRKVEQVLKSFGEPPAGGGPS